MVTKLYSKLLSLYPRPFRERFGQSMAQTFQDLRRNPSSSLTWIFCETLFGILKEHLIHMSEWGRTTLRVAAGALAAWMVPFVASQFVPDWHWSAGSFTFVYVLFFAVGMAITRISQRMGVWSYKAGVAIAVVTAFGLGWSTMVHASSTDNPANLIYLSVLVVGVLGASIARLRAKGLAWTLFAMAAMLTVISLLVPAGAPPETERRIAIGHSVNVVLFVAAGWLFRHAGGATATVSGS